MGLILDTNVFIHYERSRASLDFSQWEEYGDVYISAVTASELLVGVHYAQNDAQRTRRSAFVEAVLARVPVLGFETEEARVHAGLFAALSKQGKMIGAHDLMIAATAIAHNCVVLTENIREFARVPGLETVSFNRPT
ncbi:MAG: type II toxin-antitoxin system VapC family toxin [Candidatus Electrothrix sp. AW2]|nr:type II toxin-antitoxin system VapC family toxin [Candidatus Electrothrix sp. AX1]MCI5134261.1 type II toxin-antitoxin system VapC family toxin [Candidatus Electrothrix gigas]MCI5182529.1 type II toxin-antitoxin system VapC family toxin [Candidatus Electrothrix gigas]